MAMHFGLTIYKLWSYNIYIYTHPNTIQEDQRSESLSIKEEQAAAPESESAGTGQGLHGMIYGDIYDMYIW